MVLENGLSITELAELAGQEEKAGKKRTLRLFKKRVLNSLVLRKFNSLAKIHENLFGGICGFAGKIKAVNFAKGNF